MPLPCSHIFVIYVFVILCHILYHINHIKRRAVLHDYDTVFDKVYLCIFNSYTVIQIYQILFYIYMVVFLHINHSNIGHIMLICNSYTKILFLIDIKSYQYHIYHIHNTQ